jgi:predicted TPR repeat methyltransferase
MANARSLAEAREAALLHPGDARHALAHGEALLKAGRLPEAIGELQRTLRLDHESADARLALGRAWLAAGEGEKALDAFSRLSGVDDEMEAARAMQARPRSDAGYVRHLFDQFAADYDARMISQLGYAAPAILRQLAAMVVPRKGLDILDLGCGTGLSGLAFKDMARRLDGIDLSPVMVEKARARRIYDHLAVGDIEALSGGAGYDLLLAADTLVYLGDLTQILEAAARSLRPGGMFLFTVESKVGESKVGEGFELGPKRRWRHSELYLRQEAAKAGFEIAGLLTCAPRSEAGQPVEGFAVALQA